MPPGECGNLVPVSTKSHGTPATAMGSGIVEEKKTARGISAKANVRGITFCNQFRG